MIRTFVILALLPAPAPGRLMPISLEAFLQEAPCALVARVTSVELLDAPIRGARTDSGSLLAEHLNLTANLEVRDCFGECGSASTPRNLTMYFATEVHSSRPRVGEIAVLFERKLEGVHVEAVHGRSYWPLSERDGARYVEITWRNEFLAESVGTPAAEAVPLSAVRRVWTSRVGEGGAGAE